MAVASTVFTLYAGDYKTLSITIRDVNSSAFDITDSTLTWNLAKRRQSPTLLTKSSSASTEIDKTNSTAGVCTVVLNSSDTVNLNGVYYFDMSLLDGNDNHITVLEGYTTIRKAQ